MANSAAPQLDSVRTEQPQPRAVFAVPCGVPAPAWPAPPPPRARPPLAPPEPPLPAALAPPPAPSEQVMAPELSGSLTEQSALKVRHVAGSSGFSGAPWVHSAVQAPLRPSAHGIGPRTSFNF